MFKSIAHLCILLLLVLSNGKSYGQQPGLFSFSKAILLNANNDTLKNIFAGGMNACQYGKIKLNADNIDDLVLFDKSSGVLTTFLAENNTYIHHPEYQVFFPEIMDWLLLKDYNSDGKTDIFTHTSAGIKVYQNTTGSNGILSWKLVKNPLLSKGYSGMINVQINASDLPSLEDIDGDGDLDLICFNFFNGSQLEYHLNRSMDDYAHTDSLHYKRVDDCWGGIKEISCGVYSFGLSCETGLRKDNSNAKIQHVEASTLLAINLDGDADKDLFVVKASCDNIGQLKNVGNVTKAKFIQVDTIYPDGIKRSEFPKAAASFYEDVDFDGIKDLIVSTNAPVNSTNKGDFTHTSLVYKNSGLNNKPVFNYSQSDFIQGSMIDVGENATPAFVDVDGDGDLDLVIGNRGNYDKLASTFYSTLYLFENTGTSKKPIFKLSSKDYLGLGNYLFTSIKPYFTDLNGDHALDLVFMKVYEGLKSLTYILNTHLPGKGLKYDTAKQESIAILNLSNTDNLCFTDLNLDGFADILIGKTKGNLEYWIRNANAISYTLSSNRFGGLDASNFNTYPSPAVYDFDHDHFLDLIIADNSGVVYLYKNILQITQTNTLPPADSISINAHPFSNHRSATIGTMPTATFADTDQNGSFELYLGNASGGLIALSDSVSVDPFQTALFLKIYPNPTINQTFTVETKYETVCDFYEVTGKLILEQFTFPANTQKEYVFPELKSGVYLLKIKSEVENRIVRIVVF